MVRMLRRTHLAQACHIQAPYLYQDHERNLQARPNLHLLQVHPEAQLRRGREGAYEQPLFPIIHVYTA